MIRPQIFNVKRAGNKHIKHLKRCAALEKHKSQNNEYIHHLINSDSEDV